MLLVATHVHKRAWKDFAGQVAQVLNAGRKLALTVSTAADLAAAGQSQGLTTAQKV